MPPPLSERKGTNEEKRCPDKPSSFPSSPASGGFVTVALMLTRTSWADRRLVSIHSHSYWSHRSSCSSSLLGGGGRPAEDSVKRNAAPPPSRFSAHILPPRALMMVRQIASPRPTPPPVARPRTNLSKMCSSSPGGIHGPRSASSTVTV